MPIRRDAEPQCLPAADSQPLPVCCVEVHVQHVDGDEFYTVNLRFASTPGLTNQHLDQALASISNAVRHFRSCDDPVDIC